jgi:ABC-type multidrug transport system ATPase subunit
MLSGLLPPSFGDAFVFGRSITADQTLIRQEIAVCPQVHHRCTLVNH